MVVGKVERGRIDESESEHLRRGIPVDIKVDVDRRGANVGCMAATSLYELCDGSELVLCGCGGYVAGVEEETEEGCLAGAPSSDHEGVASGPWVVERRPGGAQTIGVIVGGQDEGGRGSDEVGAVGVGRMDALVAVLDDERHAGLDSGETSTVREARQARG